MNMLNRSDDRMHFSDLVRMADSAAHYRHAVMAPHETTRAMLVGSVTDAIVFGTEDKLALYPGKVRNGKEWEAFNRDCPARTIVIQSEYDEGAASARALLDDPVSGPILRRSQHQIVRHWEYDGVPCATGIEGERGGIDCLDTCVPGYLWDVKSTNDVEPGSLSRHAIRRWWHAQLAWLLDGLQASGWGATPAGAGLICVESSPPHVVTVLRVPERILDDGRKSIRLWIEKYKACAAANEWPGYLQCEGELSTGWEEEDNG